MSDELTFVVWGKPKVASDGEFEMPFVEWEKLKRDNPTLSEEELKRRSAKFSEDFWNEIDPPVEGEKS